LRRKFVLVLAVFCAGAFSLAIASSTSRAASGGTHEVMTAAFVRSLGERTAAFQQATWHWQRLMGVPLSQTEGRTLAEMNVDDAAGAAELWRRRAAAAEARAQHPPHLRQWLCIHHYEGSWTDAGAPYYGGLQMDLGFQRRYGGRLLQAKGTADHWLPLEQIWVAERAHRTGRGFYPWPNTARACGLI
jgi:hypothetical protein